MSDEVVAFDCQATRVRDGDTFTGDVSDRVFSYLIGFKGGTERKTSVGEGVRFLGVWCPEKNEPGGDAATMFTYTWLHKHDHPKQHAFSKTLSAVCSSRDLRDNFGRFLAVVQCTECRAVLNADLIEAGHATQERVAALRQSADGDRRRELGQHLRALSHIEGHGPRSLGVERITRHLAGQTSLALALDEQPASR